MSRLRSSLGDLAPTSRPYRLPFTLDTDAAAVVRHLRAGDLPGALRTYRGPVLPHSDAPGVIRARRHLHDEVRASVLAGRDAALLRAWCETPAGRDDVEVWTAALRRLPEGSPQRSLARIRLAAVDEEFGIPVPR